MFVVATAGHVDHGKSTLVHGLTGIWPDRLAEEQRRGLTIELGFAWTEIEGRRIAFVDVPGHERFVGNMLAGVGPVPAVLFVVAADEGWMPQSSEHLDALNALGVRHALLVITKADLADPAMAIEQARERFAGTTLADAPVAIAPDVRSALVRLVDGLPAPDPDADVRLWVDRAFTVRGAGTVVTGTLAAGRIRVGDELEHAGRRVVVRGLQSLGEDRQEVTAIARVAVNLRGTKDIARGDALLTPEAWLTTSEVDVALRSAGKLHRDLVLHLGSVAMPVRVRPLGTDFARLRLPSELSLRAGDTGLLRDPGEHRIVAGVEVLDIRPPELGRRGAATARAHALRHGVRPDIARASELHAMGLPARGDRIGDWVVDPVWWQGKQREAQERVRAWSAEHDIAAGMPVETLRQQLGLPAAELVPELLTGLTVTGGLVREPGTALPKRVDRAVREIEKRLAAEPFRAPEAADLAELGLGTRELAAAVRAGRLTRIAEGVVLGPDALDRAADVLRELPQPFTVSRAKQALGTTRRVAVPLLEALDARGVTKPCETGERELA
ncbi:selenocysteine-specific translation elongation factor [Amycolatopsis sp. K13G38]|uniref:Selenocysteine-specific translation elongation factor n=1 Tax=Amycolatopsis acididurans TaxID=2724524 RepID=A0ABX1JFU0_9PSEU|nr:selenocysteine-specific translation elongation factor [Amycolatopsis acididurans]NKQ58608.1 selenocysteine-specific translation elongation factor [Amycolatopsis acididurans]